jgi:hypothetical protein
MLAYQAFRSRRSCLGRGRKSTVGLYENYGSPKFWGPVPAAHVAQLLARAWATLGGAELGGHHLSAAHLVSPSLFFSCTPKEQSPRDYKPINKIRKHPTRRKEQTRSKAVYIGSNGPTGLLYFLIPVRPLCKIKLASHLEEPRWVGTTCELPILFLPLSSSLVL